MRRAVVVLACLVAAACREQPPAPVAASASPADAAPVGELTLPAPAPRLGEAIELDSEISVSAKVRLYKNGKFGGFLTMSVSHKRQTRAEVQEGGRVRVTYVKNRMTDVATGAERSLPVEGKSYLFDARGVLDAASGAAPSEEEDAIVRRDAPLVVAASPIPGLVAGQKLTVGRQEDASPEALASLAAAGQRYTRLSWIWKGNRSKRALLAWTGALEDKWVNGLDLRANLVGEVVVDLATGSAIEASCDGPVTIEVPVSERGVRAATYMGNGRMIVRVARRPLPASP